MQFALALAILTSNSITIEGSIDSITSQLATGLKRNVALVAAPNWRLKKTVVSYESEKELRKRLSSLLDIEMDGSEDIRGSPGGWPEAFYFLERREAYKKGLGQEGKFVVSRVGGKLSIITDGAVTLATALSCLRSNRVTWHWFYEGIQLSVRASNLSEEDYIGLISGTVGAKLKREGKDYKFLFDAESYRSRGISTLLSSAKRNSKPGGTAADYLFSAAVLKWIPKAKLDALFVERRLMEPPWYDTTSVSTIQTAAYNRLKNRFPVEVDGIYRDKSWIDLWDRMRERIDWNQKPWVEGHNSGMFGCRYVGYDDGKMFYWVY